MYYLLQIDAYDLSMFPRPLKTTLFSFFNPLGLLLYCVIMRKLSLCSRLMCESQL